MRIPKDYTYVDYPNEGWMTEEWNWTHTIGCGIASFLYIIPGIIFFVWKGIARSSYQSEYKKARSNNELAFKYSGCSYLTPAKHLGGHPFLPYNQDILIGIAGFSLHFLTYKLEKLHSVHIQEVRKYDDNIANDPIIAATQPVLGNMDLLKLRIPVEGVSCAVEFDLKHGKNYFWQVFNETLIRINH